MIQNPADESCVNFSAKLNILAITSHPLHHLPCAPLNGIFQAT